MQCQDLSGNQAGTLITPPTSVLQDRLQSGGHIIVIITGRLRCWRGGLLGRKGNGGLVSRHCWPGSCTLQTRKSLEPWLMPLSKNRQCSMLSMMSCRVTLAIQYMSLDMSGKLP